jgi:hypothetical protein
MRAWPLLLLLGCSPRERVFVQAAPPPAPDAGRLIVRPDGTPKGLDSCVAEVAIDAPGRLRVKALAAVVEAALEGGAKEFGVLVDTPSGEGLVPLRLPEATSGLAVRERGRLRRIWGLSDSMDAPGARFRPGFDGACALIETGPARDLLDKICVEQPGGKPPPPITVPPPVEAATFVLLEAGGDDTLRDLVHSLQALERRFPGKVVLALKPGR